MSAEIWLIILSTQEMEEMKATILSPYSLIYTFICKCSAWSLLVEPRHHTEKTKSHGLMTCTCSTYKAHIRALVKSVSTPVSGNNSDYPSSYLSSLFSGQSVTESILL